MLFQNTLSNAILMSVLGATSVFADDSYSNMPAGVLHFPLARHQIVAEPVLVKRSDDSFDISLANAITLFTTDIQIGSNNQIVNVQIDTGSSDLWVMDSQNPYCNGSTSSYASSIPSSDKVNCSTTGMFDSSASSSFHANRTSFSIVYGDGTFANGSYCYDNIKFGGRTVSNANFALANLSDSVSPVWGIGLIGSEALVTTINTDGSFSPTYPNIPIQLKNQGIIGWNAYSLWLNDVNSEAGSLLFGGVDHDKYSGQLQKVPFLSSYYGSVPNTFSVMVNNITLYQGDNSGLISNMNIAALLDSGTSYTWLPERVIKAIVASVGGSIIQSNVIVPCDTTGGLTFDLSGIEINVPFSQMIITDIPGTSHCILGLAASTDTYILGDTFLRSVYTVYDLENYEVAFANTEFNVTSENVEAISKSIPSAVEAPRYSSTVTGYILSANSQTFFKTGNAGTKYGDYPSGTATSTSKTTVATTTHGASNNSTDTTATTSSSSSTHKSKNAASGPAGVIGALITAFGALLMYI